MFTVKVLTLSALDIYKTDSYHAALDLMAARVEHGQGVIHCQTIDSKGNLLCQVYAPGYTS